MHLISSNQLPNNILRHDLGNNMTFDCEGEPYKWISTHY